MEDFLIMKNSKWMRFLLIVVSVAMVLSLFACGDKGGKNDETTTAAPEGTTAAPENTTVAGGETTTVAGGETTVAGGETTVAGGEDTTVAGGEDTTVAGGEDTTVAPGPELGSEENPIEVMFTMNDEYTEGTATVTVPAGATYYFQSYGIGGMNLTINDGTPTPLSGNPRMPVVFSITNEGEAEAEYALAVSYPVGSMSNPAQLVIGENTAAIEAGNTQGYYFTYTAEAAGTLTLTISSEAGWTYVVNNMTSYVYGDIQCSDSDPVVNPAVVTVAAGDVIEIIVNTYDPADMWSNPAGTVTVTAAVAAPEFEGNWHAAVDAFYYCTAPDFSDAVQIAGACTNKTVGNNISTAGSFLTSVVANFVYYEAGWIGFADHGVENFLFTVYDADGNVLKTVELALRDGEPGLSEAVQGIIGGNENTIVPRLGNDSEIIDLSEFAGQTVTVVYSADVAGTDFTVDVISLVVEVPAAQ